jgi:uncharacterized membrane protein
MVGAQQRLYQGGLWIKGINGLLELVGGVMLAIVPASLFSRIAGYLSRHNLGHDSRDWVFGLLARGVAHLGGDDRAFSVFYLLSHGGVKLVIAALLLREIRSAYPFGIALFAFLIGYEIYRLSVRPGVLIGSVVLLDLAILALILLHYRATLQFGAR